MQLAALCGDDMVCAEIQAPLLRLRSECGRNNFQACELSRELSQDGADPASTADDQQTSRIRRFSRLHPKTIEQQLPRGDGREQQICMSEAQSLGCHSNHGSDG